MGKTPLHLRDVSVAQSSLEHALERARIEGLDVKQTAAMLAGEGFGHSHAYPIRFFRNKDYNVPEYTVGELVVAYSAVSHLRPDEDTHKVSTLWRIERFHTRHSFWGNSTEDVVDLRNIRTGRLSRNQYPSSYYKAVLND